MISKTVINVKTEDEFDSLIDILKVKCVKGMEDVNSGIWDVYLSDTCIVDEDRFAFGSTKYFTDIKCSIITFEEYLKRIK